MIDWEGDTVKTSNLVIYQEGDTVKTSNHVIDWGRHSYRQGIKQKNTACQGIRLYQEDDRKNHSR